MSKAKGGVTGAAAWWGSARSLLSKLTLLACVASAGGAVICVTLRNRDARDMSFAAGCLGNLSVLRTWLYLYEANGRAKPLRDAQDMGELFDLLETVGYVDSGTRQIMQCGSRFPYELSIDIRKEPDLSLGIIVACPPSNAHPLSGRLALLPNGDVRRGVWRGSGLDYLAWFVACVGLFVALWVIRKLCIRRPVDTTWSEFLNLILLVECAVLVVLAFILTSTPEFR